ncbi:MAG TPA: LptF/LptG family permease [Methylomirabilota bacterium]|nr:LptF/LptG family permease [Methylomirabilota bacterium]
MRRLDRYLLRELCIPLGYCLGGFLVFWLSFDLFDQLGKLQEQRRTLGEIAQIYLYKLPELIAFIIPIALLLAMLYGLSNHARHNEIVAMRNAGLSIWRITLPYVAVGLVFSGVVFWLNEWAAPIAAERNEAITASAGSSTNAGWRKQVHFQYAQEGRYWTIQAFNLGTGEMQGPQVDWKSADGARHRLFAQRALYRNGHWVFEHVQKLEYPPGEEFNVAASRTNLFISPFAESPQAIETQLKFADLSAVKAAKRAHFSLGELKHLRSARNLKPHERTILDTQFHARLAGPWTCLVVALVAMPIASTSNRRNAMVGVASSIGICFLYFILMRFGLALSTSGVLPPWVGPWAPNLIFGLGGLSLTAAAR